MQIKVSLTDKEIANLKACVEATTGAPISWMVKLAKAAEPKTPARSKKTPGAIQMLNRPDLKLIPATIATVNGEIIATAYKLANPDNSEPCAVCSKPLRGARVSFVDNGGSLALAHKPCELRALGLEMEEISEMPISLYGMTITPRHKVYSVAIQRRLYQEGVDKRYAEMLQQQQSERERDAA